MLKHKVRFTNVLKFTFYNVRKLSQPLKKMHDMILKHLATPLPKKTFAFGDRLGRVWTGSNRDKIKRKTKILQSHQLKFSNYHSKCHFTKLIE